MRGRLCAVALHGPVVAIQGARLRVSAQVRSKCHSSGAGFTMEIPTLHLLINFTVMESKPGDELRVAHLITVLRPMNIPRVRPAAGRGTRSSAPGMPSTGWAGAYRPGTIVEKRFGKS